MYYVFENQGVKTIYSSIVFDKSGYFGKKIFKGTYEECCNELSK